MDHPTTKLNSLNTLLKRVIEVKDMSVEKEKDALKKRLAELEKEERQGIESRLSSKNAEIAKVKEEFRNEREETLLEIESL